MTVALCTNCGSTKFGALLPCDECGCGSTGNSDLDIAFTDHYLTEDTLQGFGAVIKCLRQNTQDEGVAFWAFMQHVSENYPEIILAETPSRYSASVQALLDQTELPEVTVEDNPRLDAVNASSPEERYMSRVRHHQVRCDSCGHSQSFAVWSRINGAMDPWLHGMIASGRLFANRCRQCEYVQPVRYQSLYLNTDIPLAIWLRMADVRDELLVRAPTRDYFSALDRDFTFRLADTPLDLAEKIQIFLDGHDDVLVEFIKICLCFQRGMDIIQPLYYHQTSKKFLSGKTMTFNLIGPDTSEEIEYSLASQKGKLEQIMAKIEPALATHSDEWLSVGPVFVMEILQNSGMMTRLDI